MSLILMAISNVLYKKRRIAFIAAVTALIASFAGFTTLIATHPVTSIVVTPFVFAIVVAPFVVAIVVATFAAVAIHTKDDKFYKILSIIFYIATMVGMILLFI